MTGTSPAALIAEALDYMRKAADSHQRAADDPRGWAHSQAENARLARIFGAAADALEAAR